MRKINVLSLFDGLSGCRIALEKIGLEVDNYYSSEIDKYAIQIANKNYPQDGNNRLGDVLKWEDWNIDWSSIDLVTGGFPCQAWSIAGKQLGDKDERGMLFWTMLDIMKKVLEHNPKAKFLIENVKMKKEFEEYITLHTESALGVVYKHLIDSRLLSAQSRKRYYWTNIEDILQPTDKHILLNDILDKAISDRDKSHCIDANYGRGTNLKRYLYRGSRQVVFTNKSFMERLYKNKPSIEVCNDLGKKYRDNWRMLSPLECELLQTLPINYTEGVTKGNRYRMIGNGWTIDVICHILEYYKREIGLR